MNSTIDTTTINRNRDRSTTLFAVTGATLVCGLGALSHYVPVPLVLLALASAALVAGLMARAARVIRWRREDREDALVAAAWRAAHPRPARTVQGVA